MTDEALRRAIIANPDDDAPRLKYADWLDENAGRQQCQRCYGDGRERGQWEVDCGPCAVCGGRGAVPDGRSERAEFIRVQCELECIEEPAVHAAKPDPACHGCGLIRRERELVESHGDVWFAPVIPCLSPTNHYPAGEGDIPGVVRRGFVESVRSAAGDWLAHGDAIRAAHPVRQVRLTTLYLLDWIDQSQPRDGSGPCRTRFRFCIAGDPPLETTTIPYLGVQSMQMGTAMLRYLPTLLALRWPGVEFTLPDP